MPVSLTRQELKWNWTELVPSAVVELVITGWNVPCRCSPARAPVSQSPTIWPLPVLRLPELASANPSQPAESKVPGYGGSIIQPRLGTC